MFVVTFVTAAAAIGEWIIELAGMTARTCDLFMTRWQRDTRISPVIKIYSLPVFYNMAACTVAAIACFVYVILTMTGIAVGAATIAKLAAGVAICAANTAVATIKSESGNGEVTEGKRGPGIGNMAVRTRWAIAALVDIVLLVAGSATSVGNRERSARMACVTSQVVMSARQREPGFGMLEAGLCPVPFDVA